MKPTLPTKARVIDFLAESNLIEGVKDPVMLLDSITAWDYLMEQDTLTTDVILKTHKILMLNSNLYPDEKGYFRRCEVRIGNRYGLNYTLVPSHIQIQFCFETMRKSPLPDWKALHVVYETIHPFVDGNGRTGRMFMNWTRIKRCNLPLLTIKAIDRQKYYQWFKNL